MYGCDTFMLKETYEQPKSVVYLIICKNSKRIASY